MVARLIFLVFLPHGNFMEIIGCNFDMFKIYKRYRRVVTFIAFFIRADKNGLQVMTFPFNENSKSHS